MCGAEGIVYVVIGQLSQRTGEALVVGFFFWMKAQVLEQQSLSALKPRRKLFRFNPDAVRREADVTATLQHIIEQHPQTLRHRLEAHPGIWLSLGTSEMRRQNQARSMTQSVLDGRQGFADARIVHHSAIFERNVKVDPHENAVTVERKITDRQLGHWLVRPLAGLIE